MQPAERAHNEKRPLPQPTSRKRLPSMVLAVTAPSAPEIMVSNDSLAISMSASDRVDKYFFQFLPNPNRDFMLCWLT